MSPLVALRWSCRALSFRTLLLSTTVLSTLLGGAWPSHGQVPDIPGWDLVWNDEFDGTSLNTINWEALDRKDSFNNEKQYYHPDQVAVSGGHLQLTAIDVPREGKAYQSGLVTSQDLFGPGRFEARIDLPTSQGMWPAFWLNANHVPWPQGGEIDIMENRGSQPNLVSSAYHWQTNPGPCCNEHELVYDEYTANEGGQPVDFHAGFHTYAAEWDETTIRFYVDDNLYHVVTETPDRPIFETPKNIILNLAVGGWFGGDPDGSTVFPQTMLVDYVRYWQRDGTPPPPPPTPDPMGNLLTNPGFDDSGGSLEGWTTFGNIIPNVSASNAVVEDGTHALKIFGQFNGQQNFSGVSQAVAITGGDSLRAVANLRTPSWDTLFGKTNDVTMTLEFFGDSNNLLDQISQVVHDGTTAENTWHEHALEMIAPAGAVEARLSFSFGQYTNQNGAIWIDSVGLFIDSLLEGDYNQDGVVDGGDYALWRSHLGDPAGTLPNDSTGVAIGAAQHAAWRANYGATSATAAAVAVPEPVGLVLALGLAAYLPRRR